MTSEVELKNAGAMRKMVIHFGPDSEGSGTNKHDFRDTDPAAKRYTQSGEPESEQDFSWIHLLPRNLAHKLSRFERMIDGIDIEDLGRKVAQKVKDMPRKKKIAAGVILAAGVAGAAYIATRRRKS
jgi:hypothetical protein